MKITDCGGVYKNEETGEFIPKEEGNSDYKKVKEWIDKGNAIEKIESVTGEEAKSVTDLLVLKAIYSVGLKNKLWKEDDFDEDVLSTLTAP